MGLFAETDLIFFSRNWYHCVELEDLMRLSIGLVSRVRKSYQIELFKESEELRVIYSF